MNELIKINEKDGVKLVSARELHEGLKIKTQYTKWFERMCEYGFIENQDFTLVSQKCLTNNPKNPYTEITDHAITIDMAKHIAMIQRTELGKKYRQYFIECENKLKSQVPQITQEEKLVLEIYKGGIVAVESAKELVDLKTKPLKEQVETLFGTGNTISMKEYADIVGIGRTTLFKILRDSHILNKDNLPYKQFDKYFEVVNKVNGNNTYPTSRITAKGQDYLYKKLKENQYL